MQSWGHRTTLFYQYPYFSFVIIPFRHTGSLECANSISLVYTPKLCSYRYVKNSVMLSAKDLLFETKTALTVMHAFIFNLQPSSSAPFIFLLLRTFYVIGKVYYYDTQFNNSSLELTRCWLIQCVCMCVVQWYTNMFCIKAGQTCNCMREFPLLEIDTWSTS